MPVQINITGGDAAEAVKELVTLQSFMSASSKAPATSTTSTSAPAVQQQPQQSYGQPQQPQWQPSAQAGAPLQQGYNQQPPGQQQQQPQQGYGQQPAPGAGAVPTSTPAYTLDQLGVATQPIMDAGHADQLIGWLQQRGAASLTTLDPKFYGDFATFLRSLGARI